LFGLSQWQLLKNTSQVSIRFQAIDFGRLDKRKKGGTGLGNITVIPKPARMTTKAMSGCMYLLNRLKKDNMKMVTVQGENMA
jgi:hypothetical protein